MISWRCFTSTALIVVGMHLCFPHQTESRYLLFLLVAITALFVEGHTGKR